ncbi:MAG: hypothetical protein QXG39_08620 [Candidatus Aenigmatarchaeota archaeon]
MKIQLCLITIGRKHSLSLVLRCIKKCEKIGEIEYFAFNAGAKKEIKEWLEKEGFKVIDVEQEPIEHNQIWETLSGETRDLERIKNFREDLNRKKIKNIFETYKIVKANILDDADFVWIIEDDQPFPPDALPKMIEVFKKYPNAWVVAGVSYYWHQPTQRAFRNFWELKPIFQEKMRLEPIPYQGQTIDKIGATGTGCVLVKKEAIKSWEIEKYEPQIGPDIDFFRHVAAQNKDAYGRWDLVIPHMTIYEDGSVELVGRIQKNLYPIIFGSNN